MGNDSDIICKVFRIMPQEMTPKILDTVLVSMETVYHSCSSMYTIYVYKTLKCPQKAHLEILLKMVPSLTS